MTLAIVSPALPELAGDLLDHRDQPPCLGELAVRLLLLEQRDDVGRDFERAVAPAARFAAVEPDQHAGQPRAMLRRARLFDPLRRLERFVDDRPRLGELAELEQHLAELGKQRRAAVGRPSEAAPRRDAAGLPAAFTSPRANARRARRRQAARPVGADLAALLVERPELAQIVVRLLEVVAEDRLELEPAAALGVDLVGPAHEVDVQRRPRALQKAAVDRVESGSLPCRGVFRLQPGSQGSCRAWRQFLHP